jgi:hypothetical protein
VAAAIILSTMSSSRWAEASRAMSSSDSGGSALSIYWKERDAQRERIVHCQVVCHFQISIEFAAEFCSGERSSEHCENMPVMTCLYSDQRKVQYNLIRLPEHC